MTNSSDGPLSLEHLAPEGIARLIQVESSPWTDEDGRAALEHQLSAPLADGIVELQGVAAQIVAGDGSNSAGQPTFLHYLTNTSPKREVLELIKQFGRQCRHTADHPLAGRPGAVLYFAAIAAAKWRLGIELSGLKSDELRSAFSSAREFRGAEELRPVFDGALSKLA